MTDGVSTTGTAVTADGVRLRTRRWPRRPSEPESWAALLLVHGLSEHSGRYEHVGRWLTEAGIDAHAYDQRGWGASGGRRGHVDRWLRLHDDLESRLAAVRELAAGLPVAIYGHSMGGLVAAGYVVGGRPLPDHLILSGPALDAEVPASRRMAVSALGSLAPTLALTAGVRDGLLSRDPSVEERFRADPLCEQRTTLRFAREAFAEQARVRGQVAALTVPTLVVHGGDDRYVPTSASAVLEASPLVTRRVYPGLRHELHNEPEGREVIADVIAWLRGSLGAAGRGDASAADAAAVSVPVR